MIGGEDRALFKRSFEGGKSLVFTSHVNPDGDAIGSQIGLARCLVERGCRVRIVNQDPTPEGLRFLEDQGLRIEPYDAGRHDGALDEADLVVLLEVTPEVVQQRMSGRDLDRFERESATFFEKVAAGFASMASAAPDQWIVVDGGRPIEDVAADVQRLVLERIASMDVHDGEQR